MKLFINFLISSIIASLAVIFLPGLDVSNYWIAIFIGLIIGVINVSVKPILELFAVIPTFITIILALFLLNGAVVVLTDWTIEDFSAESIWYVILFSGVVSILNWCLHKILYK